MQWTLALLVGAPVVALMSRLPARAQPLVQRHRGGLRLRGPGVPRLRPRGRRRARHLGRRPGPLPGQPDQAARRPHVQRRARRILSGFVRRRRDARGSATSATAPPRELVAVALGCAVFFVVDYLVSAVSIALEEGSPVLGELRAGQPGWPPSVSSSPSTASATWPALVVRALPPGRACCSAVPVVTILVATRALSRGGEHRRRLRGLFDAAGEAQVVETPAELETLLRDQRAGRGGQRRAELRARAAQPKEIGARVRTGERTLWLVAPARRTAPAASVEADQQGPRGAGRRSARRRSPGSSWSTRWAAWPATTR